MGTTKSEYNQDNVTSLLQNSKPSTPAVEGVSLFENNDRKILSQLAAILDDGYVFKSSNLDLGEIELRKGKKSVTPRGNWNIENQGIVAVIDKDKFRKFVLTGFEWNEKRQEATESISTVIAQYGYTPEFLEMYAQVGAVLTSYGIQFKSQHHICQHFP